jgi:hypothetical protein
MTFTYTKITERVYLESSDEYEEFGEDFEYEPEEEDLQEAVIDLLFDFYFKKEVIDTFSVTQVIAIKKALKNFTDDNDNWEEMYRDFKDDLKSMFEQEAFEMYE